MRLPPFMEFGPSEREAPRSIVKAVSQSIQDELHRHGQQEKEWEI